ncbi:MAG: hypothetical protein Kow0090_09580 [Myxococcota bacterium]
MDDLQSPINYEFLLAEDEPRKSIFVHLPRIGLFSLAFIIIFLSFYGIAILIEKSRIMEDESISIKAANSELEKRLAKATAEYEKLAQFSEGYLNAMMNQRTHHIEEVIANIKDKTNEMSPEELHKLAAIIVKEAGRQNLDPLLILAVIYVESRFDPNAVSQKGALGMMQLMPDTKEWLMERHFRANFLNCADEEDDEFANNIAIGAAYLRRLIDAYDSVNWALSAYNYGPGKVARIRRGEGEEPVNFWSYANRVQSVYSRLRKLSARLEKERQEAYNSLYLQ